MTSRERLQKALNHQEANRIPIDLGSTAVTGMAASSVFKLRVALGLGDKPVKVIDPCQILGEIDEELRQALGIDVIGVRGPTNDFGFENKDWKPWKLFDGTPVLVPGDFNTEPEPNGDILQYPQGDKSALPSGRMPKGGYYFDAIIRQSPIEETKLNPQDNIEEFQPFSDQTLTHYKQSIEQFSDKTDYGICMGIPGCAFGDISKVPGLSLKHPKGIRDIEEWYVSSITRREYVRGVFRRQCELALENIKRLYAVVGNRPQVVSLSGTDFGQQQGLFISNKDYRELYQPFHRKLNDWIHANTKWKCFIHTCGSVVKLIPDFIDAGFDILNPVQTSAAGMDPEFLKKEFGDRIVFWGGGIDTQRTLPFGTPDEVHQQVKERIDIFAPGGGFVFAGIHNIQARVPVENLLALFETLRDYEQY